MSDLKCPYCQTEQEINHEDGVGYEESTTHEQHCTSCNEEFCFETSISFSYDVFCREGDHDMEPWGENYPNMFDCKKCDFYGMVRPEEVTK
jgi:hypothetical protein